MRRSVVMIDGKEFMSTSLCLNIIRNRISGFSKPTLLRFLNSMDAKKVKLHSPTYRTPGNIWYLPKEAINEIVEMHLRN